MPVSRRTENKPVPKPRITITELIELRKAIPPISADAARATLSERFLLPPFSVLDARQGYWQKRKKMWLALGIQSELGRGDTDSTYHPHEGHGLSDGHKAVRAKQKAGNGLLGFSEQARGHYRANATPTGRAFPSASIQSGSDYGSPNEKYARGDGKGRAMARTFGSGGPGDLAAGFKDRDSDTRAIKSQGWVQQKKTEGDIEGGMANAQSGTSIFDPVLCELAYRWFTPLAGRVLDPFAGGSVRGIVAARLGRAYAGIDLRQEQADANQTQGNDLCPRADLRWIVGDAVDVERLLPGEYDFVFSCPPYADLERYSDDPRDLSTMGYDRFLEVYQKIIASSCVMLKDDRFACFVVGDVRDRATGNYRNFVGDTVRAFKAAGLELYNDAVLVTSVGSLPIRVGRQFANYRKLGKTHQNVLVFLKGDAGRASEACGGVDVDDLTMPDPGIGRVALCLQDVVGTMAVDYLADEGLDAPLVELPHVEACLLCDVVRGQARAENKPVPRVWVGTADGWSKVDDTVELTYLIGDEVYLNQAVFPDAKGPSATPLPARKLRGM